MLTRRLAWQVGIIGPMADTRLKSLTAGQRSCVMFAKITYQCPHLLIMDEPTNFLDLEVRCFPLCVLRFFLFDPPCALRFVSPVCVDWTVVLSAGSETRSEERIGRGYYAGEDPSLSLSGFALLSVRCFALSSLLSPLLSPLPALPPRVQSVDSLISATNKYPGALLLVSHNRDFLRKCAKQYLSVVPGKFEVGLAAAAIASDG